MKPTKTYIQPENTYGQQDARAAVVEESLLGSITLKVLIGHWDLPSAICPGGPPK